MKIAVMGPKGYGSWRIRGEPLARAHGWDRLDVTKPVPRHYDAIWLVKRKLGRPLPKNLRDSCDRLILDPLDYWASPPRKICPVTCWKRLHAEIPFDDIVATSPACQNAMAYGLLSLGVRIHMIPHQCDGRVKSGWYDPAGPVVYAGSAGFLQPHEPAIKRACQSLGVEYRADYSQHHAWRTLQGASLVLALRLGRHDCDWNRHCRPQIKIENAAAAGIPVLATGHPCEISLHPEVARLTGETWISAIARGLNSPPPKKCYHPENFFRDAFALVQGHRIRVESQTLDPRHSTLDQSKEAA